MLAPEMSEPVTATATALAALMESGVAALRENDLAGALLRFTTARRLAPANVGVLRTIAALASRNRQWPEAWSAAETGLALLPGDEGFTDNRIVALAGAGFGAAALALARTWAIESPASGAAAGRLSALLLHSGDLSGASMWSARALQTLPARTDILLTAAEAAYRLGAMAPARDHLDRAVHLEPENRTVRMARATTLLSLGIWDPGLQDYEYRLAPEPGRGIRRLGLDLPRWDGGDLTGKRLLVLAEQGVGDQMRFARDLAELRKHCGDLTVECEARLVPIFTRSLAGMAVVPAQERRVGDIHLFDYDWLAGHPPCAAYIEAGSILLRLFERGLAPDRAN